MIGRFAEGQKDLVFVSAVPVEDAEKARAAWGKQKMKGASVLVDRETLKSWEATPGTYYLIRKDGKFASGILTDLPTGEQMEAARSGE